MTSKIHDALAFAVVAHYGQNRKYTGVPYIAHPIAVMEIVQSVEHTEEMLMAAVLHDVIEDTKVPLWAITQSFGLVVSSMVEQLTDTSNPSDGNRAARKAVDRHRLSLASNEVKTIKLADLIHNSSSILQYDPDFAKVFIKEMSLLVCALKGGSTELICRAEKIIGDYYLRDNK